MASKGKPIPILRGKDAERFLEEISKNKNNMKEGKRSAQRNWSEKVNMKKRLNKMRTKKQKEKDKKSVNFLFNGLGFIFLIMIVVAPFKPWYFLSAVFIFALMVLLAFYYEETLEQS